MGRPNKLKKFKEFSDYHFSFEYTAEDTKSLKDHWREEFGNDGDIVLELACGKGEYTVGLAKLFPEKNFIGVDIQGERLWKAGQEVLGENLTNVRLLRAYINNLEDYFGENEVNEIWITFCDPHPTKKGAKKRLTHPRFLKLYQKFLDNSGVINLKIDDDELFEYSIESIENFGGEILDRVDDVYKDSSPDTHPLLHNIKTYYEKKHLQNGKTIHYLKFKLPTM